MRAIDTNVLVRLLVRDDALQVAAAETFVERGAWVPTLAIAEAMRVLESVYAWSAAKQLVCLTMLLDHRDLVLQDSEVVAAALAQFRERPSLGFSDCLMVEICRKAGHVPMGTFDRKLGGLEGAQRIGERVAAKRGRTTVGARSAAVIRLE